MAGCIETRHRVNADNTDSELAKQAPQMGFTSLNHYIDMAWLRGGLPAHAQRWRRGRRRTDGSGVREHLEDKPPIAPAPRQIGTYQRHQCGGCKFPKGTGSDTRPIGIPTLEDKVLQRRSLWCWSRSMSRTFTTVRMVSDLAVRRTRR